MYTVTDRGRLRGAGTLILTAAVALAPIAEVPAAASEAAIVTGYQVSEESPPRLTLTDEETALLGQAADLGLAMALHHLGIDPGTEDYGDITSAADEFLSNLQPKKRPPQSQPFVAVYQSCLMHMVTPTNSLAIRIPPDAPLAYMEIWDRNTGEGMSVELNRVLDATSGSTGTGWTSGFEMTPTGSTDTMLGYDVSEYAFEYSGGLGSMGGAATSPQQAGTGGFGAMVSVENRGSAWVSEEVVGIGIVRSFYQNFATQVAAGQGEGSFYGGMMRNMVGMLQHGMPLYTKQTTQSRVAGKAMGSGTSESTVTGASVIRRDASECETSTIPPGYKITQVAATSPGAGPASQPCDCSCAAFERLQEEGGRRKGESPADQAKAMCMMQCMQQFMACAMQKSR